MVGSRKLSDARYRSLVTVFVGMQNAGRNRLMEAGKIRRADGKPFVFGADPVAAKCINPQSGEPVNGRSKEFAVLPVPDSVRTHGDGSVTGTCPLCGAHVKVSSVSGGVGAHMVRREPAGKSPGLSEPNVVPVDTGSRVGDPEAGSARRASEIDGAFGRGMVPGFDPETLKPLKDEDGNRVEVAATEGTLSAVLRATMLAGRKLRQRSRESDAEFTVRVRENAREVARWRRMRDAAIEGVAPLVDAGPVEGTESVTRDGSGRAVASGRVMSPGPALVQGADGTPFAGEVTVSRVGDGPVEVADAVDSRRGWKASAGTMGGPTGRPRMDAGASENELCGGRYGWLTHVEFETLSRGQKNRYWMKVAKNKAEAQEARKRMRAHAAKSPVRASSGTGGLGGRSFVEGESSVTEQIMRQAPNR